MPRKGTKRRIISSDNKRWAYGLGSKTTLANQLISDLYSNYARNMHNKTTSTPEDAERAEKVLIYIRIMADQLDLPLWKVIDMVLARGLKSFETEFGAALELMIRKKENRLALTKAIFQWHKDNAEQLDAELEAVFQDRIDETDLRHYTA